MHGEPLLGQLVETDPEILAHLLESTPDAMVLVDRDGQIVFLNSEAEHLFGYDRDELLGQPIRVLLPERFHEQHRAHREGYMASPRTRPMGMGLDLYGLHKNGHEVCVEISLSPITVGGELLVMAAVRDVTVRKQLERDLERLRDEWSLVIAHDLRQPVAAISMHLGVLELLQQRGASLEDGAAALGHIRASTTSLNQMVTDLLDFARVEAQRLKLEQQMLDFGALVRRVGDRSTSLAPNQHLRLEVPNDELMVTVDPGRIEQVLINLVSNAAKYGNPDTEIVVEVSTQGGEVHVGVSNAGRGIPADELPQLFTRFYRSRDSRESGASGLGLGLYITKGLVEAHAGRIWAESIPDQQTTFWFTLPLK